MITRILIVLLMLVIPARHITAQEIEFIPVGDREGLNFGTIDMTQDSLGYLWIATFAYLYKYDGYSFKMYGYDPDDSTSLSFQRPTNLLVDHAGTLWVGTYGGLNRYDPFTDSFTRYLRDPADSNSLIHNIVEEIYEAPSEPGILWIGTQGGLDRFDVESGTFTHFKHDPDNPRSLSYDNVTIIIEDSNGVLWVGTGGIEPQHEGKGGLNRLDRTTGRFDRFLHDPDDASSLIDGGVQAIHEDSRGNLWVGTRGDGLHLFDSQTDSFIRFNYGGNHPNKPSRPHVVHGIEDYGAGVSFIHEDSRGALWIGGFRGGVNRYDPVSEVQQHFESEPQKPGSLQANTIWDVFEDRQGTIWILTWNGLYKVVEQRLQFTLKQNLGRTTTDFTKNVIDSFFEDRSGKIWMPLTADDWTLAILEPETGKPQLFNTDSESLIGLSGHRIYKVLEDTQGIMWLGTLGGGLARFDPGANRTQYFRHDPGDESSIASDTVYTIFEDDSGDLWSGTNQGLSMFDRDRETFKNFRFGKNPDSLDFLRMISLVEDREGNLWIGTVDGGIYRLGPDGNSFERYLSNQPGWFTLFQGPDGSIWALHNVRGQMEEQSKYIPLFEYNPERDLFEALLQGQILTTHYFRKDNTLWLGSANGLIKFDREHYTFKWYTQDQGLANNVVHSILEDDSSYLWLGTRGGLSRFSPQTERVTNYYEEDGLPLKVFGFDKAFKASNGTLYFGLDDFYSEEAIIAFHPDAVVSNVHPPEVVFSDFIMGNESVEAGEDAPLEVAVNVAEEIVLKSDQNSFAIEFAGIHNRNPEKNTYTYILEGHDEDWFESGAVRTARYSKLPPGDYTFKVKAASSEGVWMTEPATIDIKVLPPWYRTIWAYIGYGLLFIAGVVAADRFQRRRLIARERLRAEREKAQAIAHTNQELERALKHLTETQDQLIHTEKMASLGQLTAGVAHEIKNPLNFINNFAKICASQAEDIEEVLNKHRDSLPAEDAHELKSLLDDLKVNASKIDEHGQRADGIIRSMLEHSRAEPGEKRPVDLNQLLDEFVNLSYHGVRARTQGEEVAITSSYSDALPAVNVVPQEIGRVFINLLDNAFYAIGEKRRQVNGQYRPEVRVSTAMKGGEVEIEISDNGVGIPQAIRDRVFEPFFTTKPTGSGTGLGLSLSYDIVTKGHGGSLRVESEEGEGATFVISLPS